MASPATTPRAAVQPSASARSSPKRHATAPGRGTICVCLFSKGKPFPRKCSQVIGYRMSNRICYRIVFLLHARGVGTVHFVLKWLWKIMIRKMTSEFQPMRFENPPNHHCEMGSGPVVLELVHQCIWRQAPTLVLRASQHGPNTTISLHRQPRKHNNLGTAI